MHIEHFVETRERVIAISNEQAEELRALGRRLASGKTWWGSDSFGNEATVLRCSPNGPGQWAVQVNDAVGIIAIKGLQLIVEPKIPIPHLLYLFAESGRFPRAEMDRYAQASGADSLLQLVAEWFVSSLETVFRRGLICDYHDTTDAIPFVRGRLDVPDTTRAHLLGRTAFLCHFEEFGVDTPLNRVLKAASRLVMSSQIVRSDIRTRATRLVNRLDEAGTLRPTDTQVSLERKTAHYRDAYLLAQHLIQGTGRYLAHGDTPSWTFLIRTPEMVEDGVMKVLSDRCADWALRKRGIRLTPAMTLTPDIVVEDGLAVADVKYKLAKNNWNKADFNQVVTFATGYRTKFGAMVDFRTPATAALQDVPVGDITVAQLTWPADTEIVPDQAASTLASSFSTWLHGLSTSGPAEDVRRRRLN